jgi:hypothetical protein
MRSTSMVLAACLLGAASAQAADREFTEVVRVISDEFHTRPTSIPMFGLVNVFAAAVHPAGTRHIDLAVFEHLGSHDREGRNLSDAILSAVGRSWKPFVQVRSHKNGHEETVLVYMRQEGKDWKLLVTAVEHDEATVVQLLLNADALARWMASPEHCARHWSGDQTE